VVTSGTAAFEIDGFDPVERAGWSAIIVREAEEVTDPSAGGFPSGLVAARAGRPS
jgi:hypothetical protein